MNIQTGAVVQDYGIDIQPLTGTVIAYRDGQAVAVSTRARVMYETRLPPAIYFPQSGLKPPTLVGKTFKRAPKALMNH